MRDSYLVAAPDLADSRERPFGPDQPCPVHYVRSFGAFTRSDANGGSETSETQPERLIAYIRLKRHGDLGSYSQILGHGEFLGAGVMYYLHLELINALSQESAWKTQPKVLLYNKWMSGGQGLQHWKKRAGFSPTRLRLTP